MIKDEKLFLKFIIPRCVKAINHHFVCHVIDPQKPWTSDREAVPGHIKRMAGRAWAPRPGVI